jgi:hypothetical protein
VFLAHFTFFPFVRALYVRIRTVRKLLQCFSDFMNAFEANPAAIAVAPTERCSKIAGSAQPVDTKPSRSRDFYASRRSRRINPLRINIPALGLGHRHLGWVSVAVTPAANNVMLPVRVAPL